ncbi:Dihydrolipoyllysine-residue acetyltransferase component of acetoin cleaving system [compost metagenome]
MGVQKLINSGRYTADSHSNSSLHFRISGTSAPSVIFISGLGDGGDSWCEVQNVIAKFASTLAYDRPGTGKSSGVQATRTCRDLVLELRKLLADVGVQPPYILVGHSFGCLIARLFAAIHPELTAGLVLVDPAPENKEVAYEQVLPEVLQAANRAYLENPLLNREQIDKRLSYSQIEAVRQAEPASIPLSVITRGLPDEQGADWPAEAILAVEQRLQADLLRLSTTGKQRIALHSGHYIQHDEPYIVIEEIKQMVRLTLKRIKECGDECDKKSANTGSDQN